MSHARVPISQIPSLKTFIRNTQAIGLYRRALRCTTGLDPAQKTEIRNVVRHEFELTRDVQDKDHVAYLLTTGKRRVDQLQLQLSMAKS